MNDDGSIDLQVEEIVAELSPEGRLHFENAQLRVMNRKLQQALAEAANVKSERPVKAA